MKVVLAVCLCALFGCEPRDPIQEMKDALTMHVDKVTAAPNEAHLWVTISNPEVAIFDVQVSNARYVQKGAPEVVTGIPKGNPDYSTGSLYEVKDDGVVIVSPEKPFAVDTTFTLADGEGNLAVVNVNGLCVRD